jgi:hypothetical protein
VRPDIRKSKPITTTSSLTTTNQFPSPGYRFAAKLARGKLLHFGSVKLDEMQMYALFANHKTVDNCH